ncbi:hypothetical protein BJ508DRAFT_300956 [Ascobolus immersus RN42]|uniref:Uncharacterized protein n=1 Tax=Ascobolus immersus RN42 TaxID=1160509 RepID=A0A3N4IPM3_ASCIM|nr:hypothetical protein BJ508DRAFT_300956 [Ascobolus immersus RN42]
MQMTSHSSLFSELGLSCLPVEFISDYNSAHAHQAAAIIAQATLPGPSRLPSSTQNYLPYDLPTLIRAFLSPMHHTGLICMGSAKSALVKIAKQPFWAPSGLLSTMKLTEFTGTGTWTLAVQTKYAGNSFDWSFLTLVGNSATRVYAGSSRKKR